MNFSERTSALLQAPLSPLTWDSMLRECASIEVDNPYIPSGFLWALEYKRYQIASARGDRQQSLTHLRAAIRLVPYQENLQREYFGLCRKEAPVQLVAMLVADKSLEQQAFLLAHQLESAQLDYIIISGNSGEAIRHPRAVRVAVPDNYESLARKTIAGLTWIYENLGSEVGVLRLSPRMAVADPVTLHSTLQQWRRQETYAGVPMQMGNEHDRCRHWGKCEDPVLNATPYARPYYRTWAEDNAYFLAPVPLEKIVLSFARFPAQFDGEYYEDKLIGDTLMFEGVNLQAQGTYTDMGLANNGHAGSTENVEQTPFTAQGGT